MEMNKIINGEIKQTQLGITCIASIQYHTQYISINIHSTKYQHNYKISIFRQKKVPPIWENIINIKQETFNKVMGGWVIPNCFHHKFWSNYTKGIKLPVHIRVEYKENLHSQ
jgi:hypothetical protein